VSEPRKKGVDTSPEERDRSGGAVDPTGHVSSGIQTGPLRAGDEAPVAAVDEAMRQGARPARSQGSDVAGDELRAGDGDITAPYLKQKPDVEEGE
jgi:hypothetical protein